MFRSTSLIICTGLVLSLCAFKRAAGSSEQAKAGMPMSMPLVAPLFLQGNGYESSLTIINELTKAVNGIVIARAADGSELGRKAIQFGPHSQTIVAVSELLTNATGGATAGSIELVPDPMVAMDMPIAAQLSIVNNRTVPTTYLEEEFISVDAHLASRYRAVAPSAVGSPTVALLSTSMSQQLIEISCLGEHAPITSRSVELQANQMQLVPACNGQGTLDTLKDDFGSAAQPAKNAAPVALDISTNASPGSLAVWGVSTAGPEHKTKVALNFTNAAAALQGHDFRGSACRKSRSSSWRGFQTEPRGSKLCNQPRDSIGVVWFNGCGFSTNEKGRGGLVGGGIRAACFAA